MAGQYENEARGLLNDGSDTRDLLIKMAVALDTMQDEIDNLVDKVKP